jgi:hypothetical protein
MNPRSELPLALNGRPHKNAEPPIPNYTLFEYKFILNIAWDSKIETGMKLVLSKPSGILSKEL